MEIEFDFREEQSNVFGPISRPIAEITFINNDKEILELIYVDSGADITLIPKSVGELLGFKIDENDKVVEIKGIGERGVPIIVKKIKIGLGGKFSDARVGWALIEEVPLLLGRMDVFNLFNITFKKNKKTIFTD